MRWALVCLALGGCGRFGFDALERGGLDDAQVPDAPDVGYFMSPVGDDSNDGTRARPWRTFSYAASRLGAGDTLNLLDGFYTAADSGRMVIDCDDPACNGVECPRGTAGAPIVVRADRSRAAWIQSDGSGPAIHFDACSYWNVDGLVATSTDNPAGQRADTILVDDSNHVELRDLVVARPNRYSGWNAIEVSNSDHVLLEDSEVYDFHEAGVALYKSMDLTVRRVYVNARERSDVGGGATTSCTTGDRGVSLRYVGRTLVENTIVESSCVGFVIFAGQDAQVTGDNGWGDDNVIRNSLAFGGVGDARFENGYQISSECTTCALGDEVAKNNRVENSVAVGYQSAFRSRAVNTILDHVTSLNAIDYGVFGSGSSPVLWGLTITSSSVVSAGGAGYRIREHGSWALVGDNAYQSGPGGDFDTLGNTTGCTTTPPAYGECIAYPPPSSPLYAARVGADLRSVFTGANHAFPCGGIVSQLNDGVGARCSDVGARLNVGPACPP